MANRLYTLRVAHEAAPNDPAVITVSDQHTLADLHTAIQQAFTWDSDHLYSFFLSGQAWDQSSEYAMLPDTVPPGGKAARLASAATFARLDLQPGQTFLYLFDYGDEHHFDVAIETVAQSNQPLELPRIDRRPVHPPEQYAAADWDYDPDDITESDLAPEAEQQLQRELTNLFEQALEFEWGGDDAQHEPIPEHVAAALLPSAAPYPPPLDQLLQLGDLRTAPQDPDPRIIALGLTQAHVPDLVRMVRDQDLNTALSDTPEVWAPAHALRVLDQLDITAFIPDLIPVFDLEDDWMPPYVVNLFSKAGAPALEPLQHYLQDRTRWVYGRAEASTAIKEIGLRHPDLRERSIQILTDALAQAEEDHPDLNGFLVGDLLDMNATEALPVIRRAFELQCVDEMIAGGWDQVLMELGVEPDPADPLLRQEGYKNQLAGPRPAKPPLEERNNPQLAEPRTSAALPPASRQELPSQAKSQNTKKTKRKMSTESRKINRGSKKKKKRR